MHPFQRAASAAIVAMALAFMATPALADITVSLNGNTLNLNPPPVERAGRVFVPLRGVFERLGATVVYANGQINATGRGHNVSLNIGSTQAIVDGQTQVLDVAPFIIGASTYVPLRFVSQSLGAQVNWDNANQIVALSMAYGVGGSPYTGPPQPVGGPGSFNSNVLRNEQPLNGAMLRNDRPTISADFRANIDPNTVRIRLDGVDVTDQANRSATGFSYQPPSSLQSMVHHVTLVGRDRDGQPIHEAWTFTTGNRM